MKGGDAVAVVRLLAIRTITVLLFLMVRKGEGWE